MFMFLQKNKKGFTLIELMVVVAIIGILALLGLRLYTGQQDKAKEAIVKANASTIHTLIQSELAEGSLSDVLTDIGCSANDCANMRNPFDDTNDIVEVVTTAPSSGHTAGIVQVRDVSPTGSTGIKFEIYGIGATGTPIEATLTAQR